MNLAYHYSWHYLYFCPNVLFLPPSISTQSNFKIDLQAMQRMTENHPGLPVRLNSLLIAEGAAPAKAIIASDSIFDETELSIYKPYEISN